MTSFTHHDQVLMPAFQIIIFCVCLGQNPKGLEIAVYNPDNSSAYNYSAQLLSLVASQDLKLVKVNSESEAIDNIKSSHMWAALVLNKRFSDALADRMSSFITPSNATIIESTVQMYSDMTEFPIQVTILQAMNTAQTTFIKILIAEKGLSEQLLTPLINTAPPVYGSLTPDYRDFMAPGFLLGIVYMLALGHTALSFVLERKDGLLERTFVAGVKAHHMLSAHVVLQLVIIVVQMVFMMLFVFTVFGIAQRGSYFLVVLMLLAQGLVGMSFGR